MQYSGARPDAGLESFAHSPARILRSVLNQLDSLTPWTTGKAFPSTWASRFRILRSFFLRWICRIGSRMNWRCYGGRMRRRSMHSKPRAMPLQRYSTPRLRSTASHSGMRSKRCSLFELRVPDHRRDVVHVIDAFEARQWSLPVVFVCGLLEKEFPKYQTEDAILPDPRRRICNLGYSTADERATAG